MDGSLTGYTSYINSEALIYLNLVNHYSEMGIYHLFSDTAEDDTVGKAIELQKCKCTHLFLVVYIHPL